MDRRGIGPEDARIPLGVNDQLFFANERDVFKLCDLA
jgi:hypothetical protein